VSELTSRVLIPWKGSGTLMNVGGRAGLKERGSRWRGGDLPKELELVQCGRKPYISCQETTCQDALGMHRPKNKQVPRIVLVRPGRTRGDTRSSYPFLGRGCAGERR